VSITKHVAVEMNIGMLRHKERRRHTVYKATNISSSVNGVKKTQVLE